MYPWRWDEDIDIGRKANSEACSEAADGGQAAGRQRAGQPAMAEMGFFGVEIAACQARSCEGVGRDITSLGHLGRWATGHLGRDHLAV